jgi:hypothetical protein
MDNGNKLPSKKDHETPDIFRRLMDTFIGIGLGESLLRTGTTVLSITLLGVIWLLRIFYAQEAEPAEASASALEAAPTLPVEPNAPAGQPGHIQWNPKPWPRCGPLSLPVPARKWKSILLWKAIRSSGSRRSSDFKPETVLWGNYYILLDDPHALQPDQVLKILPVDGTYHEWQQGEGLNGISSLLWGDAGRHHQLSGQQS